MINRILIRIKVVQMLYSYLLGKSEFKIENAPDDSATRDRRFAYQVYVDMLLLMLQLSGMGLTRTARGISIDRKLAENRVAQALSNDDAVRKIIGGSAERLQNLDDILLDIYNKVLSTETYLSYRRKRKYDLSTDVDLWIWILENVIAGDKTIERAMRRYPEFTANGLKRGIAMLADTLRSYSDTRQALSTARADLDRSMDKGYELYLRLFRLILDITAEQQRRLDNAKEKYRPTVADLNPNTRLVDNALIPYLENHAGLQKLFEEYHIAPAEADTLIVRQMLDKILASDLYADYLMQEGHDLAADTEFWREALKTIILPSDELVDDLEDGSIYWNDDLQITGTFALKTLRAIAKDGGAEMLPKFKDDEDAAFGKELFDFAVAGFDKYREYVERFINSTQWDSERMAFMDIVILVAAIAEIINYPAIPVPVSVNEYIDIANTYSTERSGAFINGILYSIVRFLNDEGIIRK